MKRDKKLYWWVAINGASVARHASFPMPDTVTPSPTPERMFGFPTAEESAEAQQHLLTAPIPAVRKRMCEWLERTDVRHIEFKNPEPPTKGKTAWITPSTKGQQ